MSRHIKTTNRAKRHLEQQARFNAQLLQKGYTPEKLQQLRKDKKMAQQYKAVLEDIYYHIGMNISQIATYMKADISCLSEYFKKIGIKKIPHGEAIMRGYDHPIIPHLELQTLTESQLAKKYDVSDGVIYYSRKQRGVKPPKIQKIEKLDKFLVRVFLKNNWEFDEKSVRDNLQISHLKVLNKDTNLRLPKKIRSIKKHFLRLIKSGEIHRIVQEVIDEENRTAIKKCG